MPTQKWSTSELVQNLQATELILDVGKLEPDIKSTLCWFPGQQGIESHEQEDLLAVRVCEGLLHTRQKSHFMTKGERQKTNIVSWDLKKLWLEHKIRPADLKAQHTDIRQA